MRGPWYAGSCQGVTCVKKEVSPGQSIKLLLGLDVLKRDALTGTPDPHSHHLNFVFLYALSAQPRLYVWKRNGSKDGEESE